MSNTYDPKKAVLKVDGQAIEPIHNFTFHMDYSGRVVASGFLGPQTLPKDDEKWKVGPYKMIQVSGPDQHGAFDILKAEDVIYDNGHRRHRAKVIQFDANRDSAEIEFEEKGLIPPTMWVPVDHIRQAWGGRVVNTATHCPKCEVKWKETMLARFSVWDCPSCGAKKEDHAC